MVLKEEASRGVVLEHISATRPTADVQGIAATPLLRGSNVVSFGVGISPLSREKIYLDPRRNRRRAFG